MFMSTPSPAAMYGSTITLTILNCFVVALRFYRREVQKQDLRIDDWLIIPALFVNIGISIAMNLEARDLIILQIFFIIYAMFAVSLAFSKSSILFLYRRIFYVNRKWLDLATIIIPFMIAIVVIFGISISFATIFACGTHVSYWWSTAGSALKEHCIDTQMLTYSHSVSDFLIDVIIIAIPIPLVWRLHLSTKRKIGVIAIFLTAVVALSASSIKMLWFLWENQTPWDPSFDQDELSSTFIFWTVMETHVALIATCLPTLRNCFGDGFNFNSTWTSLRSTFNGSSLQTIASGSQKGKTSQDSASAEEAGQVHSQTGSIV
ncbi:hypothetical protein HYALB_00013165 [Hymenoscyphus albidus]|uniref:Rhodopsin domain-containing protein n=1 Tax=Hymenoscyphus albidus TaxID=595503 RepID=A0A9N9Q0K2_9HELO|nr:hypothetical protein HYALB_00013165 [Hymenoscyphus albidus]